MLGKDSSLLSSWNTEIKHADNLKIKAYIFCPHLRLLFPFLWSWSKFNFSAQWITFDLFVFWGTHGPTDSDMQTVLRDVHPGLLFFLSPSEASKAAHQSAVVDTPPHSALGNIGGPAAVLSSVPPPYQPVSVRHLDSQSSSEEPQDYLWLVNCESKKPEPNRWGLLADANPPSSCPVT